MSMLQFGNLSQGGMLALVLHRLTVPESFQNLLLFITKNKSSRVIASYGLAGKYSPMHGLNQGGVESPHSWRTAYDAPLCALDSLTAGYKNVYSPGPRKDPTHSFGLGFCGRYQSRETRIYRAHKDDRSRHRVLRDAWH
jgi:hypothetical protein